MKTISLTVNAFEPYPNKILNGNIKTGLRESITKIISVKPTPQFEDELLLKQGGKNFHLL